MSALHISLPETLREFVDAQVVEGGYATASEYICELLREAQKQKATGEVEALLREGIGSGEPIDVTPEYWERKRQQLARAEIEMLLREGLQSKASEMTRADWEELKRRVWERHAFEEPTEPGSQT